MPISVDQANNLLEAWEHRLGPANRPFHQEAYALEWQDLPISVAVSASTVSNQVAGYQREQVVELARLCSDPAENWATRIMLRLWRQICAPKWQVWPVKAAIAYSHNVHGQGGNIYRFDGWTKIREDAGSRDGRGAWPETRGRYATEAVRGSKTLWVWDYRA